MTENGTVVSIKLIRSSNGAEEATVLIASQFNQGTAAGITIIQGVYG